MPVPKSRSRFVDPAIQEYASSHSTGPDDHQARLQVETAERTGAAAGMQIGTDQAVLMELIVRAMGATRALEVGTFTGYSGLAIARGLGPSGRLVCCDVSGEWTAIAGRAWEEAGVADRIELRLGPALETLRSLERVEQFDFAFIDADKENYPAYYEEVIARVRVGGLILLDNVLQGGRVIDPSATDTSVEAIRATNEMIAGDPRVRVVLLPIGDGVSFVQKVTGDSVR
jgi:caffeoyl-CoA O-methyltransferase